MDVFFLSISLRTSCWSHLLLKELRQELDKKIETRRKHFHVLVASLHQLQAILDTEEADADDAHVNISDEEMDTSEIIDS